MTFVLRVPLGDGAAVGVTAAVVVVVTTIEPLVLGVEDEVAEEVAREANCEDDVIEVYPVVAGIEFEEVAREADCEDDIIGVYPVVVEMECEELVAAAVTVVLDVGIPLPLSIVLLLAAHCPAYAQYCQVAQHIDPHDISPNPLSQLNDEIAAAAAVVEVRTEIELAGAETGTEEDDWTGDLEVEEDDWTGEFEVEEDDGAGGLEVEEDDGPGDSEVEGISRLPSMENLLGDAWQQSVPPLSSGRFVSQQ